MVLRRAAALMAAPLAACVLFRETADRGVDLEVRIEVRDEAASKALLGQVAARHICVEEKAGEKEEGLWRITAGVAELGEDEAAAWTREELSDAEARRIGYCSAKVVVRCRDLKIELRGRDAYAFGAVVGTLKRFVVPFERLEEMRRGERRAWRIHLEDRAAWKVAKALHACRREESEESSAPEGR